MSSLADHGAKLWKDLWSAGHGVATIDDVPTVVALVERMALEYQEACTLPPSAAIAP
jgi:nitronate monooxygenase